MREEHQMDKNTQQLENIASGSPYIAIIPHRFGVNLGGAAE